MRYPVQDLIESMRQVTRKYEERRKRIIEEHEKIRKELKKKDAR
jgi:hypothetical protein